MPCGGARRTRTLVVGDEEWGLVCLGLASVHTDGSGRSCAWRAPMRRGLLDVVRVMGVRP